MIGQQYKGRRASDLETSVRLFPPEIWRFFGRSTLARKQSSLHANGIAKYVLTCTHLARDAAAVGSVGFSNVSAAVVWMIMIV